MSLEMLRMRLLLITYDYGPCPSPFGRSRYSAASQAIRKLLLNFFGAFRSLSLSDGTFHFLSTFSNY